MHFSRQLGVFVKAGIPIMEALEVIAEETTDKLFKQALLDMIERLQAGDTFASAAAAHPEAFPDYYIGILASAELTGTLDVVLDQLADYIERDIDARGKITGALIYPAVVFVMAIVDRRRPRHLRAAPVQGLLRLVPRQAPASDPHAAQLSPTSCRAGGSLLVGG